MKKYNSKEETLTEETIKEVNELIDGLLIANDTIASYNNLIHDKLEQIQKLCNSIDGTNLDATLLNVYSINRNLKDYITLSNSLLDKKAEVENHAKQVLEVILKKGSVKNAN